jgi:hypothetical protein
MATIRIPGIDVSGIENANLEQLRDIVFRLANITAMALKELEWLLTGNLDVKNIKADGIQAKNIKAGSVTADKINVSELSAISANLGKITAGEIYGTYISTAENTYPRIDFSSVGNLLAAYLDSQHYIAIDPDLTGSPTFTIFYNGNPVATWSYVVNTSVLFSEGKISLQSADEVNISTPSSSFKINIPAWERLRSALSNRTLQQEFDTIQSQFSDMQSQINSKPNAGINATISVVTAIDGMGNPIYALLRFTNGVLTSVTT